MKLKVGIGCIFFLSVTGCSSLTHEGGLFEDQSMNYKNAHSLEKPLTQNETGGQYVQDALYPVPNKVDGPLFDEAPRVSSAFISLEQNAIVLNKRERFDRLLFSNIYANYVPIAIDSFAKERHFQASDETLSELKQELLATNDLETIDSLSVTQWISGKELGYKQPGFWSRLFGARKLQHQFAFFVSAPKLSASEEVLETFPLQLHMMHRTRVDSGKDVTPWMSNVDADEVLGLEVNNFVEHLKQQVALATAGKLNAMTVTLEKDGNGLPYLAISNRFALVWEMLLRIVPGQDWNIVDRDRSTGILYVEVPNKKQAEALGLSQFQLQLSEGPQMMVLSVEVNDDQPAEAMASDKILSAVNSGFSKLIEVNNND